MSTGRMLFVTFIFGVIWILICLAAGIYGQPDYYDLRCKDAHWDKC